MRPLFVAIFIAFGLTGAVAQAPAIPGQAPALRPPAIQGGPNVLVQAPAPAEPPPLTLDATVRPLGGALQSPQLWAAYKARFVSDQGRIVDTGNGLVSHSEGQGYGMLLAVAARDRVAFDLIWGWTRANLMVRDDQLVAWRWEPGHRPAVADINNATDGDILIAWALTEAAELWGDVGLRVSARRIAVEIGRKLVIFKTAYGALLLPAVSGFSTDDRRDGPVVNLSYYVFPAFSRLPLVAPEVDWSGLTQAGLDLLKAARFGAASLPTDWISVRDANVRPAEGFPPSFSYNAIRIPLYLAWAGIGERDHYTPFVNWANRRRGVLGAIDLSNGRDGDTFSEAGYAAIGDLIRCVTEGKGFTVNLRALNTPDNYYPATLRMIAVVAEQMRYGSCARS